MSDKFSATEEIVIKEYPQTTHLLDDSQTATMGNLILTTRRLVFLRQTALTEKEIEKLQKLAQEATTEQLMQFALSMHKKNFQTPLPSIISAKLRFQFVFPTVRPYMTVSYRTAGKNAKTLSVRFVPPPLKRLLMSEFPTMEWVRAINKAVKAHSKANAA